MAQTTLGAALGLPLVMYAMTGTFSRYTADDFCWAGTLRIEGFVHSQVLYYTIYSPRYAFTFLIMLVESIGPAIVPALPAAAIASWLATLTWTLRQFNITTVHALLIGEVAAFATLQTAPDLPQSLYWQTGMLTYLLPLVLATFLLGWIRRGVPTWWAVALGGLVTFVAGGLSETYLIPQNVALTLALAAAVLMQLRTSTRAHLAAALAGGVLALLVIVVAPATANRVGRTPADLWLAMSAAIATGIFQVLRLARYFALTVLVCIAVPALLGSCTRRISAQQFVMVTLGVAVTLPFCYFPSFYAQNGNPPARSLVVPGAILIGYLIFLGFAFQSAVIQRVPEPRRALAGLALALVPIGVAAITAPQIAAAAQYASLFDAEDQQIRASRGAGNLDLTVPPLPANLGEEFITSDRQNFMNVCVARFYGLRSIATPS